MDVIPGTYNLVFVDSFISPDSADLTKTDLQRLASKKPDHGGQWDAMVDVAVNEEFPRGAGPYLARPFNVSDEGLVTDKFERFVTKKRLFLLNEEKREECLSKMVSMLVTPQSGAQEYLTKKIARDGTRLVQEAMQEGREVLHIEVHVDIGYGEVDFDNMP